MTINKPGASSEEPEKSGIEDLVNKFSAEHPEFDIEIIRGDTPEARQLIIEEYFLRNKMRDPTQIVVYESEEVKAVTKEQWPAERAFITKTFELEMFNKILYFGPLGGAHSSIDDRAELDAHLDRIERGFESNPERTLKYSLGMNIQIQGYDHQKQRFIVENKPGKFIRSRG